MGLTLVSVSSIIDNSTTTDLAIAAILNAVTTTHVYSVAIIPISNTSSRIIMIYD